ncbi:MAG TPA: hypothetical protein VF872_01965 [Gaiellaceae bacterium]
MKRLLILLLLVVILVPSHAVAAGSVQVNGGGRGTVDGGVTPFSQFGFGVSIATGGSAQGHFTCLMAGSSVFAGFEPLMKVDGEVRSGSASLAAGTAAFSGSGTLNLGPSGRMPAVFHVEVTEGGPGVGTFRLTVTTPDFPLPTETVLHGRITIH